MARASTEPETATLTRWLPFEGGVALDSNEDPKPWKVLHEQYTLCVIRHGAANWSYRNRNFTVTPGAVYVCEPGEVHRTTKVHCPGDFTALFLDETTLPAIGEQLGLSRTPHFSAAGVAAPDVWDSMMDFRQALDGCAEARRQKFSLLVARLLQRQQPPTPVAGSAMADSLLERARKHLLDIFYGNPTETVRLQPVARDLGVGYHSLIRDFSRCYGLAPYEYIDAIRARHAFATLRRGPTPQCRTLAEVAVACGYSDGPHMSRSFRRHFGITPRSIARQLDPRWMSRSVDATG